MDGRTTEMMTKTTTKTTTMTSSSDPTIDVDTTTIEGPTENASVTGPWTLDQPEDWTTGGSGDEPFKQLSRVK